MRVSRIIETVCVMMVACCCNEWDGENRLTVPICCSLSGEESKSVIPDADVICNLNVFVIGCNGMAEEHRYWDFEKSETAEVGIELLSGRKFDIYAFANAGYDLGSLGRDELERMRWYLRYPDSFDHGLPMSCVLREFEVREGAVMRLNLVRMVSRISVKLDRSLLDKDVDFFMREARIGNCAKSAGVFFESGAVDEDDIFFSGFHTYCGDEFELYTMENCVGGKVEKLCSYVEMEIDYKSDTYYSSGSKGLVYRFYLRDEGGYDVRRNCHYHVTVRPHADGLMSDDSWRVDKSELLGYESDPYLRLVPSGTMVDGVYYANYYRLSPGDSLHLTLSRNPPSMRVTLDKEMVDMEREDGRAVYSMDSDGRGFGARSLGRICRSAMNICVEEPYSNLNDMIIIDVGDHGSGQ